MRVAPEWRQSLSLQITCGMAGFVFSHLSPASAGLLGFEIVNKDRLKPILQRERWHLPVAATVLS